ncbi:MAG: hypothetical protein WCD57_15520 [Acidobacteriaceae bacterium]
MADVTFVVRFKLRALQPQLVSASRVEIQGDHLVFLDSHGTLIALFLMEAVESWSEIPRPHTY